MRKRKIWAFVTLVAFALTMMPMGAFAASASNSSIAVDDSSAKANGEDTLTYIVDLDDDLNTTQSTGDSYTEVDDVSTEEVLTQAYYNVDGTTTYNIGDVYDEAVTYYNKVEGQPAKYEAVSPATETYLTEAASYISNGSIGGDSITVIEQSSGDEFVEDKTYVQITPVTVEEENFSNADYYTENTGSYTKATNYDSGASYFTIEAATPTTEKKLTADYYTQNEGVYTEVESGTAYVEGTTYYKQTQAATEDSYSIATPATKAVLAETYYNSDGSASYTSGSDYDSGTKYYQKETVTTTKAAQYLFIWAERNGSYSDADYLALNDEDGTYSSYLALDYTDISKGESTVYVKSNTAGTITLKAYIITSDYLPSFAEVYNGSSDFLKTALVGSGDSGKFSATSSEITVEGTVTPYVSGDAQDSSDFEADATYDSGLSANNGVDYYYVSLKFKKGGSKLVGEDVAFAVDKNGATINKEEDTTSATGAVNFKVSASKAGTYTVTIDCGSYSESIELVFGASSITKVNVVSSAEETIAVDQNEEVAVEVVAYDANDNSIKASDSVASTLNEDFSVEVTSAPSDSSWENETLSDPFKYNSNYSSYVYLSFEPDAIGSYTLKIYNNTTGVADYAYLTAEEFGTIASATISYDSASYTLGSTTETPTVKVVDQNGVTKTASKSSTTFSYSGVGVASFDSSNGVITFKDDEEYVGNQIIVNVVVNNKVSASTTITIGNEASYLSFEETDGAIGEEVTVTGYAYDADGNLSAVGGTSDDYTVTVQSALITSKPEGSTATIDADNFEDAANNFLSEGYGTVVVSCNTEGTVVGNVVIEITDNDTSETFYLAGVVTINFGEASTSGNNYAQTVTMILGSNTFVYDGGVCTTDVAPFISNGRTMIAIRALAESTGADVEYNDATQTVTITGDGIEATMIIGSNILTVNGETTVMDASASIVDGRTVIPVRYAAEILGYDFELTYDDNGNIVAVTMYQE